MFFKFCNIKLQSLKIFNIQVRFENKLKNSLLGNIYKIIQLMQPKCRPCVKWYRFILTGLNFQLMISRFCKLKEHFHTQQNPVAAVVAPKGAQLFEEQLLVPVIPQGPDMKQPVICPLAKYSNS